MIGARNLWLRCTPRRSCDVRPKLKLNSNGSKLGSVEFEWDPEKAAANATKHKVQFYEAMTVFADPLELMISDPDHSEAEQRFLSIGASTTGRLLVVAYTERAGRIRIVNAREATARERRHYESTDPSKR